MEQKTITFYDESYYEGTACDCCEGDWVEAWNCGHDFLATCFSREDCYIEAMHYFGYPITTMTDDDCYNWTEDELESIAREWQVVVDFVS